MKHTLPALSRTARQCVSRRCCLAPSKFPRNWKKIYFASDEWTMECVFCPILHDLPSFWMTAESRMNWIFTFTKGFFLKMCPIIFTFIKIKVVVVYSNIFLFSFAMKVPKPFSPHLVSWHESPTTKFVVGLLTLGFQYQYYLETLSVI